MKKRLFYLTFGMIMLAPAAMAATLNLSGYQEKNGAVTSFYRGDTVDPYFANKALLLASDGDLKAGKAARAWIAWALDMQRDDGLFERYRRDADGNWYGFATADADDAVLALWIEVLHRFSPASGMPAKWKESAEKAQAQLDLLYDEKQGIYHIFRELPVGLLMDNTEIHAAYVNIARDLKRMHLHKQAQLYADKAELLKAHIAAVFNETGGNAFSISTQPRDGNAFYPDKVAQIFPMLYQVSAKDSQFYEGWMEDHGREWLVQKDHDFSWGLLAVLALSMGDDDRAACWQNRAEPMRYSAHWNVVEEAALQQVKAHLVRYYASGKIACVGGSLV